MFTLRVSLFESSSVTRTPPRSPKRRPTFEKLEQREMLSGYAPTASNITGLSVLHGRGLSDIDLIGACSDPENDFLSIEIVNEPTKGSVSWNPTTDKWDYSAYMESLGADYFTYRAFDGDSYSNVATVSIDVTNSAPSVTDVGSLSVEHGETIASIDLLANSSDTDQDSLTITIVQEPTRGYVTYNETTGKHEYTAYWGERGADSFKFRANDGAQDSNEGWVFIQVTNRIEELNDISDSINSLFDDLAEQDDAVVDSGNDLWADIAAMNDAIDGENHVAFHAARQAFDTDLTEFGTDLNQVMTSAQQIIDKAKDAIQDSQGDKFRIKGIFSDLMALDEGLASLQEAIEELVTAYAAVRDRAQNAGIDFGNQLQAMNNTLNTLQDHADSVADMRDEIDGVINGNVPNAPNNQTIQQLNGLSDDIDNFFGQLASPETSFYGWGLTAAQAADEMQQALNNSNGTAFGNSVQGYVNAISNLGIDVDAILGFANQIYEKADEARGLAQDDEFRLKGIDADIARLEEILAQLVDALTLLINQLEPIIVQADNAGSPFNQDVETLNSCWFNIASMIQALEGQG